MDGVYVVSGLAASGFTRGPMAGKLLALLIDGEEPAAGLARWLLAKADPARFLPLARAGGILLRPD